VKRSRAYGANRVRGIGFPGFRNRDSGCPFQPIIASMKSIAWVLVIGCAVSCRAAVPCSPSALSQAAAQATTLQRELENIKVEEMDTAVPADARDLLDRLKDALTHTADAALGCAPPLVNATELQASLAEALHANPPEPPENTVISSNDHRFDEAFGSYGHNLRVRGGRPQNALGLLVVEFAFNIACGNDHMLLVYALDRGAWVEKLRWQAPPLKDVSDAYGDFFVSAILPGASTGDESEWRVIVAHGRPWCTSRFSGFKTDLLAPGVDPHSPRVLWKIDRGYSRFEFAPKLKTSANTFELRLNDTCMDSDAYERRVIYRYRVNDDGSVQRVGPIAINARGFVEEWLSAPWAESRGFLAADASANLQAVHDQFDPPSKPDSSEFVTHAYGPVRACKAAGVFQVQIDSTLEKMVPGKPGGDSSPLPSRYFHVREVKDGYSMISAPSEPDPACSGSNLMPANP